MAYDAWGSSWGSTSAWGSSWRHAAAIIDTHDGEEKKRDRKIRGDKLRLHNQIEEAFTQAFRAPVLPQAGPIQARVEQFIFPAYREMPAVDEDDEDDDFLLLSL